MSKPTKCPRCGGPAKMIDKAPPGESGDVVWCLVKEHLNAGWKGRERQCATLADAAREVETTHMAVVDATQDFTRAIGKPANRNADVIVPGYLYADLLAIVTEWKGAGQALHDLTVAHASAAAS